MAKAEDTGTAGAAEAMPETETEAGSAVQTIEERLEAGLRSVGDVTPPETEPEGDDPDGSADERPIEDAGDESPDEDGQIKDGEVEGLSAKAQEKVNKRIHELNIKRKDAEKKAEEAAQRLSELDRKVQDESVQAVMKLGIDPDYINEEEAKLIKRFDNLRAWKKWLRKNRDGYEGSGSKEDPSMSAEDVAEREAAVEDELLDVAGPARGLWTERVKQMRADMALGRKMRLERERKPGGGKAVVPTPPKLSAGTGATRKPTVSAGTRARPAFDSEEFNKGGADVDALEKQYEKVFGR